MKKSTKIWIGLTGVLLVALGIICICNPLETLLASAWIIGLMTLFSGVATLIFTLKTQLFLPNSGTRMLSAILQIVLGLFFLANKWALTASLPVVFSVWVMVEGVILMVDSFDYKKVGFGGWWCICLTGAVAAVLGCLGLRYPLDAGKTLSLLIGLSVIFSGIAHFVALAGISKIEKFFRGR